MMTRGYQGYTRYNVARKVGNAFDYAINGAGIPGPTFTSMFLASKRSKLLEQGDIFIKGISGLELAVLIIEEATGKELYPMDWVRYTATREFWIGYALSYYQSASEHPFSKILAALPYDTLAALYPTLHEADITKFFDVASERMKIYYPETNLKQIRSVYGCSQAQLAEMSGVKLRSIQMYEQRHKDINKASAETLYRLAKALRCDIDDLLERPVLPIE